MSALKDNAFAACTPSLGTTIDRCGSVTQCSAIPLEIDEIDSTYLNSGNYKIMDSIFQYEFEIAACQARQKGLASFLRANKKTKSVGSTRRANGTLEIEPFVMAKREDIINNQYWTFSGGLKCDADGTPNPAGAYWYIVATSPTGIPAATGWFNIGERMYLNGLSGGGTQLTTSYTVTLATVSTTTVLLVLNPQNAGSNLPAARVDNPVTGFLMRGTANVSDYEKFCAETPGLNPNQLLPYWVETTRMAMCRSELYDKFRMLLMTHNAQYAMFGDIDEVTLNKQQASDYEDRFLNNVLWSKPINASQTLSAFRSLPEITVPAGLIVTSGMEIGRCVGRKANVVGIYEQHAACSRVVDLQGGKLNLPALFESFRLMQRVRSANGSTAANTFDIYTDQLTAQSFRLAMLAYYKAQSQDMLQMHISLGEATPKQAPMGFMYETYTLFYPSGLRINVIWDESFDDLLTEASAAGVANAGRWLWVLDWTKNYVATVASNKVVNETGNLKTLAAFDSSYACVMNVPTKTTTLYSQTYAVVCECPAGDLIISNFSDETPEPIAKIPAGSYG